MDASVISGVHALVDSRFTGGPYETGGASLAPFYELDRLVSPQVKAKLEQVKQDISAGKIKTKP